MAKPKPIAKEGECSICHGRYENYGHNPEPLRRYEDRCCTTCNETEVIAARIMRVMSQSKGRKLHSDTQH